MKRYVIGGLALLILGVMVGMALGGVMSPRGYRGIARSDMAATYVSAGRPLAFGGEEKAQLGIAAAEAPAAASSGSEATVSDRASGAGSGRPDTVLDKIAANQPDRYLIKNATLTIETDDARNATDQLVAALQDMDGYVSNLQESVDGLGRRSVSMQVRVPAAQFDACMTRAESIGKVLNKQITTQDVTEEYVDTDARTRNLKKTEERLLDHLNRYGELNQVIQVEQELTRVRGEIERFEGRLKYLSHRAAYSTMTITLRERPKAEPIVPAESFSTAQVVSEAARSLVGFTQGLWARLIWAGVWSPFWLPPVLLLAWLGRRLKRGTPPQ